MTEPVKNTYVSVKLIGDKLESRGYSANLLPLSNPYIEFVPPSGRSWLTKKALVSYPFISLAAAQIGRSKRLSCEFAELHGAIVPRSLFLPAGQAEADAFLADYAPIVVKPLSSFSSHGLTLDITTPEAFESAVQKAYSLGPELVVQQQFSGSEIRFMVLKGEVVSCLLRETPRVIGDGLSTVEQLIAAENQDRQALNFTIVPYPVLDASIIDAAWLHDQSVPAKGEVVELGKASLVNEGASMRDITADVHDSYKAVALKLAQELNPQFAGVDMLVQNYSAPLTPDNYVFLEFTFAPSLRLYYDVRSGNDYDIASALADMIDEYCAQA